MKGLDEIVEDNKKADVDKMKSVELVASGYEWVCPECDTSNDEIEVTKKVICERCKREYAVEDYIHAVK